MVLMLLVGNQLYALLRYIYQGAPAHDVLMILVYRLPQVMMEALPGSLLLGTALALNRLEHDREILSMRMAGVRLLRLVMPYILVGVVFSGVLFYVQERLMPDCALQAKKITNKLIYGTTIAVIPRDVVFKVGDSFFYIREVNPQAKTLTGVIVCKMEQRSSPVWLTIPLAVNDDKNQKWYFKRDPRTGEPPRVYIFNEKGDVDLIDVEGEEDSWLDLKQQQDLWVTMFDEPSSPDELTFRQLHAMRQDLRVSSLGGMALAPAQLTFYLNRKIAVPLGALVAILIAIPLAVRFGRSGGHMGLLLAVVVAFCFIVSQQWARVLAEGNHLHPLIAAWAPNAFFGLLGIFLLLREE